MKDIVFFNEDQSEETLPSKEKLKLVTDLGKLYLLPKIHKRFHNVPGRPVISNCGTPTEKASEFLDFHLKPLRVPF